MIGRGKNISTFLMDGDDTGRIKCTMSNWIGVIYKAPRNLLSNLESRVEMKQSGIYFLFGEEDQQKTIYIGQATTRKNGKGVLERVKEHTRGKKVKDFTDVVILTTQNNSFGPTEISYLENKFTRLAQDANLFLVKNSNEPNSGNVTEEKQSELDEVVENTRMIIGTLGYHPFVSISNFGENSLLTSKEEFNQIYFIKRESFEARCEVTSSGFIVLKESNILEKTSDSLSEFLKKKREKLMNDSIIKDGILLENQLFPSLSAAAKFVLGYQVSGLQEWKDRDGRTLKELEELDKE